MLETRAPASKLAADKYFNAVQADGANAYWRFGESAGTSARNWTSDRDLTLDANIGRGKPSAIVTGVDKAVRFNGGTAGVLGTTKVREWAPQAEFSEELWFRTGTTTGGKMLGFGSSSTEDSATSDRHLYLGTTGKVSFGVASAKVFKTVTSPKAYNNAKWHHVVATLGSTGMRLYVDGKLVASDAKTTFADPYSGVWRVAGDSVGTGYGNLPNNTRFNGELDEIAVYGSALTAAKVTAHFNLSGR